MSRDVHFVENDSPMDLAEFEIRRSPPTAEGLTGLVPDDVRTHAIATSAHTTPESDAAEKTTPEAPISIPEPAPEPVIVLKASKWANLPHRDHLTHDCHSVERYGIAPLADDTSESKNEGYHRAYIAYEENEPKTYDKAMNSTYAK
ncbi:hypothetical protein H0H92_007387, partial [Tricholoma furcatifolium]